METETLERRAATQGELTKAYNMYADDDICFDDDAVATPTDCGGTWVQAWVWVPA